MAKRSRQDRELESSMGGASDATSGGGAGRGIPDPDTVMRLGRDIGVGDVEADKAKLFPELSERKNRSKGSTAGRGKSAKASAAQKRTAGRPGRTTGTTARKGVGQGRGSAGRPHGRVQGKAGAGRTQAAGKRRSTTAKRGR